MKIIYSILLATLFITSSAVAQSNNLLGRWKGEIELNGINGEITYKKIELNIISADRAELLYLNESSQSYTSYRNHSGYKGFSLSEKFSASENFASFIILKKGNGESSQEIFNICFDETTGNTTILCSQVGNPLINVGYVAGFGELIRSDKKFYTGKNLIVGGQSYSYIKIRSIELQKDKTVVIFEMTNNDKQNLKGTVHEPGHATAFYITNADRSRKYRLVSASKTLPFAIDIAPGKTQQFTLNFEAIPGTMKLMNIFEGGPADATNLWKFYDVRIMD